MAAPTASRARWTSSTTVDPATGAVSLRAVLPNPQQILPRCRQLQANLGERNNAYLVPQQALLRDTTGGYVMVVGANGRSCART